MPMPHVVFGLSPRSLAVWEGIHAGPVTAEVAPDACAAVARAHATVAGIVAAGRPVYGVNTGFGRLSDRSVGAADLGRLQSNLVLSHCVGAGAPLSPDETRLVLAMKVAALAQGYSGVRPQLVDLMLAMLNRDILPVIPSQGSVGASGDLAPLAHLSAPLIGVGAVWDGERQVDAAEALAAAGLRPLALEAKEGLALLNGTQVSTTLALAGLFRARAALDGAVVVGALATEAVLGSVVPFEERIQRIRPHPGQAEVAGRLRRLTAGSAFRAAALEGGRLQDPYCIRCQPQILGACLDLLDGAAATLEREAASVTDNPLVFPDAGDVVSGGNFHAEPVAFAADMIALAICEVGTLSERRLAMMVDPAMSGLPPFLTGDPGLCSGFMSAQIAAAAMVAENRQKAHPASVDNVPTVANQEDHVSMATHGARRLVGMADTLDTILAFELLAAVEACDHRGLALGPALEPVRRLVRAEVPRMDQDRWFAPDHGKARAMVRSGRLIGAIRS